MKMRVLYFSGKKKIADLSDYLSKNVDEGKEDLVIPPAYSLQNERLLVLGVSVSAKQSDVFTRFVRSLTPKAIKNLAVFSDSDPALVKSLMDTVRASGVNVIDDVYYIKTGVLPFAKATEDEKKGADAWFEKVQLQLK